MANSLPKPSQAYFADPRPLGESLRTHDNNTNDNNLNIIRSSNIVKTSSNNFGSSGRCHEPSSLCLTEMGYDFMENGKWGEKPRLLPFSL